MRWRWRLDVWAGTREAKKYLEASKAQRIEAQQLSADVRRLREENHIAARVHAAMRGGRS